MCPDGFNDFQNEGSAQVAELSSRDSSADQTLVLLNRQTIKKNPLHRQIRLRIRFMAPLTVFMLFPVAAYTMSGVLNAYTALDTYAPRPSLHQTGLNFRRFLTGLSGHIHHAVTAPLETRHQYRSPSPIPSRPSRPPCNLHLASEAAVSSQIRRSA